MANLSTLRVRSQEGLNQLLSVIRDLLKYYRENNYQINWKSRPVVLFISTILSTGVLSVIFSVKGLLEFMKERKVKSRPSLQKQSSKILKNGSREIFVPYKNREIRIVIPKPNLDTYAADKYLYKNFKIDQKFKNQHSLFNSKFANQLTIIWSILIPKVFCENSYLLTTECAFLILRTWLSLLVAKLDGQIVKNLISGNGRKFTRDLIYWFLIAFPASYTNSGIKYLTRRLSLNFRTNLMRYVHDIYLDNMMTYYKVNFNSSDIQNIDQYITYDITKFCDSICSLFSNMGKPIIDLVFFSIYLRDNLGTAGIAGIFVNYFLTGYILKKNTPPFGKLSSERTSLEGSYYNYHLNLITNSEEIAFYKGEHIEKLKIDSMFEKVLDHTTKEINAKLPYTILEDYILKYTWSALGYLFSSIPFFIADLASTTSPSKVNEKKNMRQFITNKRLMLSLADAGSRLMYSIKDVSELTGYTDRIFSLLTMLHETHAPKFEYGDDLGVKDISGTTQINYSGVRFEKLPIIIPSKEGSEGVELITELNFQIKQSQFLLVLGPNGCGKTSIARVLAGLWPIYTGLLSKPNDEDIFYLPQKTYFSNGNLRDQIIYPYSYDDMVERGISDNDLLQILSEVKLDYLLTREGGNFNIKKDWKDVLSGGEKQRVSIARILFKKPKFVILDESTNAISNDVEDYLFDLLRVKNLTFITFSHRPLLMKYHDYLLEIKSNGEWEFSNLGSDESILSIEKEIKEIESKLSMVEKLEARKLEIEKYLNEGDINTPKKVIEVN